MNVGSVNGFRASFDDRVLIRRLRWLGDDALPTVTRNTLNLTARRVEQGARQNAQRRLTIRTKYSLNGIKQDRRALGNDPDRMFARVRVRSEYMRRQDVGETVRARSRYVPIATVASRVGGSESRRVARRYAMDRLGNIGGKESGYFMGKGGKSGDLAIWQRTRNGVRMIRRLGHRQVRVRPTHFFRDSIDRYGSRHAVQRTFRAAARAKLRRMPR